MDARRVEGASAGSVPTEAPDLRWISPSGIERRTVGDLPELLEREDGFLWVDIPTCDVDATGLLADVFAFHPHAVQDCLEKRRIPKVHTYAQYVFVILHDLEFEEQGWGHLVELAQFVGDRYLVTVHGPRSSHVSLETALRHTRATLRRLEGGTFAARTPAELGHGIVSALILHLEGLVETIAERVAVHERSIVRRVDEEPKADPQEVIEQLFRLRHQLLLIRTAAGLSREVFAGRATVARSTVSAERLALIEDIVDQYERLTSVCDAERAFLDQVLEFHQARTVTKMNVAMERLALIAAVLLPITAISSIYGMNVIVNGRTDFLHTGGVLLLMLIIVVSMLRWTRRKGWW
jgi:Mg2+ and Co2+ transporter CorA